MAVVAVCDQVCDSLLESGLADTETIDYGEFLQNSLTCCVMGAEAVSTMGITEHNGSSANTTILITNWDKYLNGWDLGNRVLQLVVETFLFRFR